MTKSLGLIARPWNGVNINRRVSDGYVNATAMCLAGGKRWPDYIRLDRTQAYIAALAAVVQIPTTGNQGLIQTVQGGSPRLQGTWVHPRLAVDLARWISPAFAVWMDGWFLEELQAAQQPAPAPRRRPRPKANPIYSDAVWDSQAPNERRVINLLWWIEEGIHTHDRAFAHERIHSNCRALMEAYPVATIQDQLAPVVDLLREAVDRLDQVAITRRGR